MTYFDKSFKAVSQKKESLMQKCNRLVSYFSRTIRQE
jgi:hypothetical protein